MEDTVQTDKPLDLSQSRAGKGLSTRHIVRIGMLSAVAIVLMQLELAFPIFPYFLKMDASDLPALIGAVTMGPLAGVLIELIKNLLHLFKTSTVGVGEVANFLVGIALVVPIGICYKRKKTLSSFIKGALIGTVVMIALACAFNYFILIPAYSKLFGAPIESFIEAANAINSNVVDLKTLVLLSVGPFNGLKAIAVSIVGYPLCRLLDRAM